MKITPDYVMVPMEKMTDGVVKNYQDRHIKAPNAFAVIADPIKRNFAIRNHIRRTESIRRNHSLDNWKLEQEIVEAIQEQYELIAMSTGEYGDQQCPEDVLLDQLKAVQTANKKECSRNGQLRQRLANLNREIERLRNMR